MRGRRREQYTAEPAQHHESSGDLIVQMLQRGLQRRTIAGILRRLDVVQHALARKLQAFELSLAIASSAVSLLSFAKAARSSADSIWDSTDLLSHPRAMLLVWHF